MPVTRKAGSIVIQRLRERIRLGRYFGRWRPGDRLPSVREVALLERVDRKTAAAAYRRLEQEGLVRVEPRSGVYLEDGGEGAADPLRRLHLQWLERTLASAEELGLSAEAVCRMFQGVRAVERRRIPVVDPDPGHASLLAQELAKRTGLECVGAVPDQLPARSGPLHDPPFIVATPRGGDGLNSVQRRIPIVTIDLAAGLFEEVCRAAGEEPVVVHVGSDTLKSELEQALERGLVAHAERVQVVRGEERGAGPDRDGGGRRVLVWPGASGELGARSGPDGGRREGGAGSSRLVSRSTVENVRCQVARAALEQVSRSSAYATRA